MAKVSLNPWHEAGDVQVAYHECLNVGQCRKPVKDAPVESLWRKVQIAAVDDEGFHKGKQSKPVHVMDGIGPYGPSTRVVDESKKGGVEMRNGGDVPGVTGERA